MATAQTEKPKYIWGTGRRKSSVARVRVRPGAGSFVVNDREMKEFLPTPEWQVAAMAPLVALDAKTKFDVVVNVNGGGGTGQSGAISMGLARALVKTRPRARGRDADQRAPDPGCPHEGAQEVRPSRGPPLLPVQQALIGAPGRARRKPDRAIGLHARGPGAPCAQACSAVRSANRGRSGARHAVAPCALRAEERFVGVAEQLGASSSASRGTRWRRCSP